MAVGVYINFAGNCRDAVHFYKDVFGTEEPKILSYGDRSGDPSFALPEEAKKLVMHTQLNILGNTIMFSDTPPGMPFTAGNNISLIITSRNAEEVKRLYNSLKEGGTVTMELQETFWSKSYGMVTDKFGINWQISMESETAPM